ncbi:MAG: pyridoxamine 5'-phosphate oxidase family protein [Gammaproteobacteria bacterium]|nr:pyridoxamine 5'-phosphate oxidase family protein [Gammaproteobacteria bacterium]MDE0251493.1 pyridoxamine 5'-phosphate oxidase family protein [Gammaproteobacteria bacterium]MDE0401824.1 pyridoxamine 5'-phosphate oxidase family protein [Gammaproteobacteria bacterium]
MIIDSLTKLRTVYPPPNQRASQKVLDYLDRHCRHFLALSTMYVMSSARGDGRSDASPRGDPAGSIAYIWDKKTLLLPDRPGNRQVDTLMNLLDCPFVGLVFFVPGMTETLRINGKAVISTEKEFLAPLAIKGKLPISVLKVTVEEVFLHCSKALIRGKIWDANAQIDRSSYPTYGQVLADQIADADAAEIDAGEEESVRTDLY